MTSINDQIIELFDVMGKDQAEWQRRIGFGEEGDLLREINADVHMTLDRVPGLKSEDFQKADSALRNYYIAKLALITTEVAEAIEELRHNHKMDEAYYSGDEYSGTRKPEGVPSELADIVIRCWSLAGEAGIDLGAAIVEKLAYNETRAPKHGGKAI